MQERSMNFTRLALPAALAGAVLLNQTAHAQTPIQSVAKVLRDTGKNLMQIWASDMRVIVDNKFGSDRRSALMARTTRLNNDLKSLTACASNEDTDYLRSWLVSFKAEQKLPLELNYKPQCDFDRHVIINGDVAIASFRGDLDVEDALYSQALATKDLITTGLTKWAAAERSMIDAASGSSGRTQKFNAILEGYKGSVEGLTCHPKVALDDFNSRVTETTKPLPVHLISAQATCEKNNKWHIALEVHLDETAPGWSGNSSKWADISNTVLRKPSDLVTDQQKKDYIAKLGPGGDYVKLINKVACSEEDTVVGALKKQGESLKAAFSRFSPSFDHCKEGHVNLSSVSIELAKPDSKASKPETKKTGTQK
jgi:hypothetical protein